MDMGIIEMKEVIIINIQGIIDIKVGKEVAIEVMIKSEIEAMINIEGKEEEAGINISTSVKIVIKKKENIIRMKKIVKITNENLDRKAIQVKNNP